MKPLEKIDIVGQKVSRVLQTPWEEGEEDCEGIWVCRVFIVLENGKSFELKYQDSLVVLPIDDACEELNNIETQRADFGEEEIEFEGDEIVEVLTSELWPSNGLLLSSHRILFCRDRGVPGSLYVGAFVSDTDSIEEDADRIFSYWDHRPLPLLIAII